MFFFFLIINRCLGIYSFPSLSENNEPPVNIFYLRIYALRKSFRLRGISQLSLVKVGVIYVGGGFFKSFG